MSTHAERAPQDVHDHHDHDHRGKRGGRWVIVVGIALVLIAAGVALALFLHARHANAKAKEEREHEQDKGLRLTVVKVQVSSDKREVTTPAEVRAFESTTLYAKVSGFVRSVKVERGQRVKKDQVLAELESPETVQSLEAAKSDAMAKHIMADRMRVLSKPGVVSKSDLDLAVNEENRSQAAYASAAATQRYATIRAPFDGVVTARYVDNGTLLPAATGATQSAQPIFDVASIDSIRVFAYVGQDVAMFVHDGDVATIWQDETGGRKIPATVSHVTSALDPRTRTMQVEVDLDNREWKIVPGSFVHLKLEIAIPPSPAVPNDAILIREGRANVAVVDGDKLHFKQVELGPNDGKTTRVLSGLAGGEQVGINVPIELGENSTVRAVPQAPQPGPPPHPGEEIAPKKGDVPNQVQNVDAGSAK